MRTSDFDYALPPELIATVPAARRDGSRLLVLGRRTGAPLHGAFEQIVEHVPPHAVIVLNDTRVMPARLRGRKPTGGAIELLLVRRLDATTWEAMGRNLANVEVGAPLVFEPSVQCHSPYDSAAAPAGAMAIQSLVVGKPAKVTVIASPSA